MSERSSTWHYSSGPIGRILKVGYTMLRREMRDLLKDSGLTYTQWSALRIIFHFPGITASEMEQILLIERPSVTSLLNGLAKKGYIVRKDDPKDGRSKLIYLTQSGLEITKQTEHFGHEVEKKLKERMDEQDFKMLEQSLLKMIEALKS